MATSTSKTQVASRTQHDWEGETDVSMTVLAAIADATGREMTDLPPLYEQLDPEALDGVFTHASGDRRMKGSVSFEFAGHSITIHSSGDVVVYSG